MISGASTRIEWIPSLAAFRAGRARGTEWDSANVGQWSIAIGDGDTAKGQQAIAGEIEAIKSELNVVKIRVTQIQ